MCTAAFWNQGDGYFGRTLDLEYTYNETVTVTPRNFIFDFGNTIVTKHYAIIGMATVANNYPLYYDAANEKGLCMAGLNFPKNAVYFNEKSEKRNIASFELIPYILSQCDCVEAAKTFLEQISISNRAFSCEYTPTPLHWMIADRNSAIVVESCADGLHIYDNKVGILTNEPPFPHQLSNLCNYANLSDVSSGSEFLKKCDLIPLSRSTGALGLPGDWSSPSRFVRAAFVLKNAVADGYDESTIVQFFKILGSVEVPCGCVSTKNGENIITQYTSCMNMKRGIYYYKTYGNSRISAVDMNQEGLDKSQLISYPLRLKEDIFKVNDKIRKIR